MSWPKKTWVDGEWVDFKTPGIGPPKGFPDDWKEHKSSVDNSSYWDILDNPLYEAAANAQGLDWEEWKADAMASIGSFDDYESNQTPYYMPGLGMEISQEEFDDMDDGVSKAMIEMANNNPHILGSGALGINAAAANMSGGVSRDDPDLKNWGIDRGRFGAIAEDLDNMHEWLGKTIKSHSLQESDIITHGLDGSDYGIDGDLWEHYGLDKPPAPPKAMDLDYEFNLIQANTSTATYRTPAGFPVLDKSNNNTYEKVSYGDMKDDSADTYYNDWTRWQEQEARAAQHEQDHTSYGETVSSSTDGMSDKQIKRRRWQRNVKEIIGKDQDHKAWAEVAGVTDITSRNDSDKIKKVFREYGGDITNAAAALM